jgi:hypothetical protein
MKPFLNRNIYALPTFQPIRSDMTAFTVENGELKDHMLTNFISLLLSLRQLIFKRAKELNIDPKNIFFDGVEPSTGSPYLTTSTSSIYSEIDGSATLLKYKREQSGQCSLLSHPKYALSCYPATFFIGGDFPIEEFIHILKEIALLSQKDDKKNVDETSFSTYFTDNSLNDVSHSDNISTISSNDSTPIETT